MDLLTYTFADVKFFLLEVFLPFFSIVLGVLPLVLRNPGELQLKIWRRGLIALSLTLLTTLVLFSRLPSQYFWWLNSLALIVWTGLLFRNDWRKILYKLRLYNLRKIKVSVIVPSDAIFNQQLVQGFKESKNNAFDLVRPFNSNRISALEDQKTDIDYAHYIRNATHQGIKVILLHIKSRMLYEKEIQDSLIENEKKGGVIINLVSRLDVEPFLYAGVNPPFSVYLDDASGVQRMIESLDSEIRRDHKVLLLTGPDTSETSIRRLEKLSSFVLEKKASVDVEHLHRWTARLACEKMKYLVSKKNKPYDWVLAWNDEIALGVCDFYENASDITQRPRVVGFDNIPEATAKIKSADSIFYKTVDFKMKLVGKLAAENVDLVFRGVKIPLGHKITICSGDVVV